MKTRKRTAMAVLLVALAFTACKEPEPEPAHEHQWGNWGTPTPATETENGTETRVCKTDQSHKETQFSGEYATGTAGLQFDLISINDGTDNAYRVHKGSVTTYVTIHIPAYHRTDANSPYLPVTTISNGTDTRYDNAFGIGDEEDPNITLTNITFAAESQLTSIGDRAFYWCTSLTSIEIPEGITDIGNYAFRGCTSLTRITIFENVTSVGVRTFQNCTSLTSIMVAINNPNYTSEGGTLYNKDKTTLIVCPSATDNVTIPSSVTTINAYAFGTCTSLTSITIPTSVTTIDAYAFSGWTNTQTINVPFANADAKPVGWSDAWSSNCNAVIKYWNGTTWE